MFPWTNRKSVNPTLSAIQAGFHGRLKVDENAFVLLESSEELPYPMREYDETFLWIESENPKLVFQNEKGEQFEVTFRKIR